MSELEMLKKQVAEFMAWKEAREAQQLTFPIDVQSQKILNEHVLTTTGEEVVPVSLLSSTTALEIKVDGATYWLLASPTP